MKKISVIFIVIIFALVGIAAGLSYVNNRTNVPVPAVQRSVVSTSPKEEKPQIAEPQRMIVSKLGIDAVVEAVGEDAEGKMDVPKEVANVGWYSLGFKPGEKGNAVIDGHLDTVSGAPAVFYNIGQLRQGDEITVTDKNGKDLTFIVVNTVSYPFDQVPLKEVFGPADKPKLNLITCVGTWDAGARNYSDRMVVYSEMK